MDFTKIADSKIAEIEMAIARAKSAIAEINLAKEKTVKFLDACKQKGINKISIQTKHASIPESMTFPFGVYGSVFQGAQKDKNGWPAIWAICNDFGFGGAGNTDQHSIPPNELFDGVYHCRGGKWSKVA